MISHWLCRVQYKALYGSPIFIQALCVVSRRIFSLPYVCMVFIMDMEKSREVCKQYKLQVRTNSTCRHAHFTRLQSEQNFSRSTNDFTQQRGRIQSHYLPQPFLVIKNISQSMHKLENSAKWSHRNIFAWFSVQFFTLDFD